VKVLKNGKKKKTFWKKSEKEERKRVRLLESEKESLVKK